MHESHDALLAKIKAKKGFFKLCLVGDGATGKTTFMRYLATGNLEVCHERLKRTPYIDFGSTKLLDKTIQIVDLAGQRFDDAHPLDHIPVASLKAADILLFFFALDNFDSYLSLVNWYEEIRSIFNGWGESVPPCILVGNKTDLTRCVERINGEDFIANYPEFKAYHEISLLSGDGVFGLVESMKRIMDERN